MKRSWLIGIISVSAIAAIGRPISDTDATNAIVGEAAAQPYIVKLGIADALRNRSIKFSRPLRGVYGFHAAHNLTEPARVWKESANAWQQSATNHIVKGATHFGNRADVQKGTFEGMTLTCTLGTGKDTTYFFKP